MAAPTPVWSATIDKDGKLHVEAGALFRGYLARLKNQRVRLTLRKEARPKSRSQLGYWWAAVIPVIAEHCGYREYEYDAVHDAVLRALRPLKPAPNPLNVRASMADMSHEELSALIEDCRFWALETLGVVIPDPTKVEAA